MTLCPTLVKIVDEDLQKSYGCQYLLQVYTKEGQICFERTLKNEILTASIFRNTFDTPGEDEFLYTFVYVPSEVDGVDGQSDIHVVTLDNNMADM